MTSMDVTANRPAPARRAVLEWPTLAVTALIYTAWGALTWFYHELPLWLTLPAAAYVVAWHGSLQHEAIHAHPTRRPWLNELLVFPNLWLWMPYRVYRDTHLAHHRDESLTDPLDDPESYYLTAEQWRRLGTGSRALMRFRNTVLGRLLIGPIIAAGNLWRHEARRLLDGNRRAWKAWGLNAVACGLVLAWVIGVCDIPLLSYVLVFVWPAISLTLLRSFAEHRAEEDPEDRSVVVDAAWPFALLFLNNNLHWLHHHEPGVPWYDLPARYRAQRETILAANGNYRFRGYGEILRRYLVTPKEPVLHPEYGNTEATRPPAN